MMLRKIEINNTGANVKPIRYLKGVVYHMDTVDMSRSMAFKKIFMPAEKLSEEHSIQDDDIMFAVINEKGFGFGMTYKWFSAFRETGKFKVEYSGFSYHADELLEILIKRFNMRF